MKEDRSAEQQGSPPLTRREIIWTVVVTIAAAILSIPEAKALGSGYHYVVDTEFDPVERDLVERTVIMFESNILASDIPPGNQIEIKKTSQFGLAWTTGSTYTRTPGGITYQLSPKIWLSDYWPVLQPDSGVFEDHRFVHQLLHELWHPFQGPTLWDLDLRDITYTERDEMGRRVYVGHGASDWNQDSPTIPLFVDNAGHLGWEWDLRWNEDLGRWANVHLGDIGDPAYADIAPNNFMGANYVDGAVVEKVNWGMLGYAMLINPVAPTGRPIDLLPELEPEPEPEPTRRRRGSHTVTTSPGAIVGH